MRTDLTDADPLVQAAAAVQVGLTAGRNLSPTDRWNSYLRIALTALGRERLETLATSHIEELARLSNEMHTLWAGLEAET